MTKFRVLYETPETASSTEMTHADEVIAENIPEAIEKSLAIHVASGHLIRIGITMRSAKNLRKRSPNNFVS